MNTTNFYPVFEADQVLTNKHLNDLFNYIEQQSRLTRIKLIGSGIVCGLEITSQEKDSISISKGCGLTSQGYLITFCDTKFTHAIKYNTRNFPGSLLFIKQCEDDITNPNPFYKENYKDGFFQLLTTEQFDSLSSDEKQNAFAFAGSSVLDLKKHIVVLFLETEEEKLKNCDSNDCNDKGSRMDFEVKALLVEKEIIDGIKKEQEIVAPVGNPSVKPDLHHVELKRYNVPMQDLKSADDVIQAFANLVNDAKLKSIAEVLNYCFVHYYYLLENETSNPFADVWERFKRLRDEILKNKPVIIQYFYDFIDDVLNAYYEFKHKVFEVTSACCDNEMKFPLHIMLGEATISTAAQTRSNYREYFIYSPLFNNQKIKLAEVRLLFTRLKLLINAADFNSIDDFENRYIKITPSRQGYVYLSDKCIPFYYKVAEKNNEIYKYWSYEKTRRGNDRFNLSYNAFQYCAADNVIHPLLYDIGRFNFFRVEGHIGKNITTATTLIKSIQQQNNLPFDITALSADYIGALVKGEEPQCVIQDLESDYRILLAEFICLLHDAFCNVAKIKYTSFRTFLAADVVTIASPLNTTAFRADTKAISNEEEEEDEILKTGREIDLAEITRPFVSSLVGEFHSLKSYRKGDTLFKLCRPAKGTVGEAYLSIITQNNGKFKNPGSINRLVIPSLYYNLFEFLDRIETMLEILMSNELGELDITFFKVAYDSYETAVKNVFKSLVKITDNTFILLHTCIVEQLEALKSEYLRRSAQYRLAKNFSYYFKTHGGIEHKAGVPAGGTFILVYHEERKNRFIDKSSFFINKELSNLMLANFREIIEPSVPLDTLVYKTKLLQTAVLYKDPELYGRFKDVLTKYLDDCKDLPDDKRDELTDIINEEPKKPHFELTDGMVIADFYIPYICCSDCPPVTYILPEKPVDEVVFDIQPRTFLFDDAHNYPFTTVPPVTNANKEQKPFSSTELENDDLRLWTDENNILYLHPAMELKSTLKTTVTYKGIKLPITIINPDASFTVQVTKPVKDKYSLQFEAVNKDATKYTWMVNNITLDGRDSIQPYSIFIGKGTPTNFKIELMIAYTINDNISNDSKKIDLGIDKIKDNIGITFKSQP